VKSDGCPSYCEISNDDSRKTCIVKSRRRSMERKKGRFFEKVKSVIGKYTKIK